MVLYIVLFGPLVVALLVYLLGKIRTARKRSRRQRLLSAPVSDAWRQILAAEFGLYRRLPAALQRKLLGHINVFLNEKILVGCNGMEITEQVRVLIAAQACLLILNKPGDYYPGFQTILVYPETYVTRVTRRDGALHSESLDVRAGESWQRGPVVLAWNEVLQGARDSRDGHNVVIHEFAHKLDEQNSAMDGLPVLSSAAQYQSWAQVFSEVYKVQQQKLIDDEEDVIDSYAATSAAEFFAVVTETFFEKPAQLQAAHPQLYGQLQQFYQLDPLQWEPPD
ncbi:zinc-dependent peptidase [Pseudomaricurvus alcaniphilus]|uniref:M90 family metallopeptidase n=1 Tax=Pseudomaricurvus alcaniphilus TaxID=1166482 RepID=UPI00140E30C6|nr:M90 family metallopeptidase [Pseudomaricurvus alcaniphilus]NHN36242.1 zinc-dependent peptidase [Pseudomaricurvus alcaniphilus]